MSNDDTTYETNDEYDVNVDSAVIIVESDIDV